MQSKNNESQENASFDLDSVLSQLTVNQIRFVVARQEHNTDKEAAESLELKPNVVSQWKHRGVPIDEAIELMALDGLTTALHVRRKSLAKAMLVKIAGLDSENEPIRQKVATEIIEWETGKASQQLEHTGKDGGPIEQTHSIDLSKLTDDELGNLESVITGLAR